MPLPIKISTPDEEGVLQVSKSRKLPLLIDLHEMVSLFEFLEEFEIFDVSRAVPEENVKIEKELFLEAYSQYIEGIQRGTLIDEGPLRPLFSAAISARSDALYAQPLSNGKYLIKFNRPIIQLQRHHFIYSDRFHSGVMSEESVTWGIQFSYPQLYLDPKSKAIGKVEKNPQFLNTKLFQRLATWVRNETVATPFLIGGKRVNQPMRLGKRCFEWVNHHPMLKARGLCCEDRNYPSLSH